MKKLLVVAVILLVFFTGCSKKSEVKDISELLPENTISLVKFNSVESFINTTAFMFKCDMLKNTGISEIKDKIGIDLTDPSSLAKKGVDIKRDMGIGLTDLIIKDGKPAASVVVYLPVSEEGTISKELDSMIPADKREKTGHFMTIKTGEESVKIGYKLSGGYLLVGVTYNQDMANLLKIDGNKLLKDYPVFNKLNSVYKKGKTAVAYINTRILAEKLKGYMDMLKNMAKSKAPQFDNLKYLASYSGGVVSADLSTKDLLIDSYFLFEENSEIVKLLDGVKFDKKPVLSVDSTPVMLFSIGLNMVEYYKNLMDALPEDKRKEAEMKVRNFAGIDFHKELIENLDGNVNLGLYDGKSFNMGSYNALLSFNVKDTKKMSDLLDKLIGLTPPQTRKIIKDETVNGVKSKVMVAPFFQINAGIKDKSFIISLNRSMYEKAVAGDTTKGFASKLEDMDLRKAVDSEGQFLYFSFPEALKVLNNFSMIMGAAGSKFKFTGEQAKAINSLGYVYSIDSRSPKHIEQKVIMKTGFSKPFMQGIADMVEIFSTKGEEKNSEEK